MSSNGSAGPDAARGRGGPPDDTLALAADRTVLACERTYSAWMRTGLAAVAAALGLHGLLSKEIPAMLLQVIASALLLFGALCFVAGAVRSGVERSFPAPEYISPLHRVLVAGMNLILLLIVLAAAASMWL